MYSAGNARMRERSPNGRRDEKPLSRSGQRDDSRERERERDRRERDRLEMARGLMPRSDHARDQRGSGAAFEMDARGRKLDDDIGGGSGRHGTPKADRLLPRPADRAIAMAMAARNEPDGSEELRLHHQRRSRSLSRGRRPEHGRPAYRESGPYDRRSGERERYDEDEQQQQQQHGRYQHGRSPDAAGSSADRRRRSGRGDERAASPSHRDERPAPREYVMVRMRTREDSQGRLIEEMDPYAPRMPRVDRPPLPEQRDHRGGGGERDHRGERDVHHREQQRGGEHREHRDRRERSPLLERSRGGSRDREHREHRRDDGGGYERDGHRYADEGEHRDRSAEKRRLGGRSERGKWMMEDFFGVDENTRVCLHLQTPPSTAHRRVFMATVRCTRTPPDRWSGTGAAVAAAAERMARIAIDAACTIGTVMPVARRAAGRASRDCRRPGLVAGITRRRRRQGRAATIGSDSSSNMSIRRLIAMANIIATAAPAAGTPSGIAAAVLHAALAVAMVERRPRDGTNAARPAVETAERHARVSIAVAVRRRCSITAAPLPVTCQWIEAVRTPWIVDTAGKAIRTGMRRTLLRMAELLLAVIIIEAVLRATAAELSRIKCTCICASWPTVARRLCRPAAAAASSA